MLYNGSGRSDFSVSFTRVEDLGTDHVATPPKNRDNVGSSMRSVNC